MRSLSFILILIAVSSGLLAQSPHGTALKLDCSQCHESTNWNIIPDSIKFNHNTDTQFPLAGQHKIVDCRSCHESLVFSRADETCISCHRDLHQGTVGKDCQACHTPQTWIVENINLIHQQSRFPLVGAHQSADCIQCHAGYNNLTFEPIGVTCVDCHRQDYLAATNPNHQQAGFSTDCQDCHSITSSQWSAENFIHDFFPLTGGHNISDCFACHQQGGNFTGLSADCYSCHQEDFQAVQDPNHVQANFSTDCTQCHNIQAWSPAEFNHNQTEFALTGAHINVNCSSCHTSGFTNTPMECAACHQEDFNQTTDPNHSQVGLSTECQSCHNTSAWIPSSFDHAATSFALLGQHAQISCNSCHEGTTTGLSQDCISCHQDDYNQAPEHSAQNYPVDCTMCHNFNDWSAADFNHANTQFPLTGAHTTVDCSSCHTSGFSGTPAECAACHQDDFNNSANPNHTALSLPTDCQSCHTTNPGWEPAQFPIHDQFFQLTGAHAAIANDCASCHNGNYVSTPADCIGCHQDDYNNTANPNHSAAGFGTDCQTCHNTNGWTPASFDHDNQFFPIYSGEHQGEWNDCSDCHTNPNNFSQFSCITCHAHNQADMDEEHEDVPGYIYQSDACLSCHPTGEGGNAFNHQLSNFPLLGAHNGTPCASCHTQGYAGTPTECQACHQDNYNTAPNHAAQNYPTTCEMCHNSTAWNQTNFNHQATAFPLTGAHINTDCSSCHSVGFAGTPTQCQACHQDNYNTAPNHTAQNYPTTCEMCHNSTAWNQTNFNHQATAFPLTGAHISADCSSCHSGGFAGTPTQCQACHLDDFNATSNPNHSTVGISNECQGCHNTNAWIPSSFDHAATSFPLLGQHAVVTCESCHQGTTTGLNNACVSCHQAEYNTAPDHASQNYPTNCEMCHNSTAWSQTNFNHQNTAFPLTGAHISTDCSQCHSGGFAGTPTQCQECHQGDYQSSANPNHQALSIPTDCQTCHTTNPNWAPASFPIHNNYFQLIGAHSAIANDCISCHNGNYITTPNTCYECHQSDYNSTTNPPHQAANFPHECLTCHTQTAWLPSTFNHDQQYFPIYSGEHQGEWNQCSDCHTNNNYSIFSCIDCHEHNQVDMDEEHEDVPGYVYNSQACFNCHPDGEDRHYKQKIEY